ncbi:cobalamin-binding protein [Dehalogenimonas sp. THU2]|uniref:ABC transporter substrate-binding protein n=1 Tax=Dehalogenimonas sp. THU2 TaxID=3151121 RepID=UPI00321859F7
MKAGKIVTLATALLVAVLGLSLIPGCTEEETPIVIPETIYPLTIVDQLDRTVTINAEPQRIISLAPSNTEIVYALGLEDKLVGVTTYCNYPAAALEKPKVGGFSTADVELITAAQPDLIIAANIHASKVIPQLEALGFTVIALSPDNLNEVLEAIEMVGKVANVNEITQPLVDGLTARVNAVTSKTQTLNQSQLTRTFYIVWHEPLQSIGSTSFINSLISVAGGVNIVGEINEKYPKVSPETVLGKDPQVIIAQIGMGSGEDLPLQWAKTEPLLASVSARVNGQVFGVISDVVGRSGPRIVDALEELAKMIHPELFS